MHRVILIEEGSRNFYVNGKMNIDLRDGKTRLTFPNGTTNTVLPDGPIVHLSVSDHYECTCDHDQYTKGGDRYVYSRQKTIELPAWSRDRKRRLKEGMSTAVCIDQCIVDAILQLWDKGIETTGCCCGHNKMRAWVSVHPDDYAAMFELGYEQRPVEVAQGNAIGLYHFYL